MAGVPFVNFIAPTPSPNPPVKHGFPEASVEPYANNQPSRPPGRSYAMHTSASRNRILSRFALDRIEHQRQHEANKRSKSRSRSPSPVRRRSKKSTKKQRPKLVLDVASSSGSGGGGSGVSGGSADIDKVRSRSAGPSSGDSGNEGDSLMRTPAKVLTATERKVLTVINKFRAEPQAALAALKEELDHCQDEMGLSFSASNPNQMLSVFRYPPDDPRFKLHPDGIRMKERRTAIYDAMHFLEKQEPLPRLNWKAGLSFAARDHAADVGLKGISGPMGTDGSMKEERAARYGRVYGTLEETIEEGVYTPERLVLNFIVDDGNAGRPRRKALFDSTMRTVGVGVSKHRMNGSMAVVVLAEQFVEYGFLNQSSAHSTRQDMAVRQSDGSIPCPGCKNNVVHPPKSDKAQFEFYLRSTAYVGQREWHIACLACQACARRLSTADLINLDGTPFCEACAVERGAVLRK